MAAAPGHGFAYKVARMALYLGLMSGTSMDGIDAALLQIDDAGMRLLSAVCREWPPTLQRRLRHLAAAAGVRIGPDFYQCCGVADAVAV